MAAPRHLGAAGAGRRRRARPPGASAAVSSRGSTAWSSGTSRARRTVGASAGSARRAADGSSRSACQPQAPAQRELAVERLGLVAVARDDERARGGGSRRPRRWRRAARPANDGQRRALSSPSASSARSPASASVTGASMPARHVDVAAPDSPRSSTQTLSPRRARATRRRGPRTPPPTTTTSRGAARG